MQDRYTCICADGYYGQHCEDTSNTTTSSPISIECPLCQTCSEFSTCTPTICPTQAGCDCPTSTQCPTLSECPVATECPTAEADLLSTCPACPAYSTGADCLSTCPACPTDYITYTNIISTCDQSSESTIAVTSSAPGKPFNTQIIA